jgi:xanthine dehydrogenase YagS FAD-binding subunit
MKSFDYQRPGSAEQAVAAAQQVGARFIAGGTNLVDLMKVQVETPAHLVDISRLPLRSIDVTQDGGLRIGALVSNTDLAADSRVRTSYPLLSRALLAGASGQLRNMASTGGNLLQRTRCYYFYDVAQPCNKRKPGSGCAAMRGFNRIHAVLGASDQCIAVHPSDMAVALRALDAEIETLSADGKRRVIPIADFHKLPGDTPQRESELAQGELITAVTLPPPIRGQQVYRKVRDRASYAFALVSVAAAVLVEDGVVQHARIAFGGLAHKPWRADQAEQLLTGQRADNAAFTAAAESALAGAQGYGHNDFKIALAKRSLRAVLQSIAENSGTHTGVQS